MKKSISRILPAILVVFLISCESGGETSTISISFSNEPGKAAISIEQLVHVITLTGPGGDQTLTIEGSGSAKATVLAGTWQIDVLGFYGSQLYSMGTASAEVKAGRNTNVSVLMTVVWTGSPGTPGGGSPPGGSPPSGSGVSVTISPSTVSVEQGRVQRFTATVTGDPDTSVTWTYSGSTANYSPSVNDCDVLIDISETVGATFTLTATSVADPTKSESATITVTLSTASYGITITPGTPSPGMLTPLFNGTIHDERETSFSVTIGGFPPSSPDATNVKLSILPIAGLTFSVPINTLPADTLGEKTFTVDVSYNGSTAFTTGSADISFSLDDYPSSYYIVGLSTLSIPIRDGQAATATRQIPVNSGNIADFNAYANDNTGRTRHYLLTTTITLSGTNNWTPIGTSTSNFTGSFDGGSLTITGLNINSSADYQGMFGYIARNGSNITTGVVRNLGLINVDITGGQEVGSLAGQTAANTSIVSCYATGMVNGAGRTGGLVGWSESSNIQYCYFNGHVKSTANYAGGLIGFQNVPSMTTITLQNCYYSPRAGVLTDKVDGTLNVGGLVGLISGATNVYDCYSTGTVTGSSSTVGGLIGNAGTGSILNCYSTCTVSGTSYVGGIMGDKPQADMRNSVALNLAVSGTSTTVARVGNSSGFLTRNFARRDMGGDTLKFTDISSTGKDGIDIVSLSPTPTYTELDTLWSTDSEWDPGRLWNFSTVWNPVDTGLGRLPTLQGMPGPAGAQNPTLP